MKIKKIAHLKNCGIFHDFRWKGLPDGLPDFERYNLFYGWNGSGKTTLSNLLHCFEPREDTLPPLPLKQGSFKIKLSKGEDITQDNYTTNKLPIRVFNRQFVDEVIYVEEGMKLIVFIGGKDVKNAQKLVDVRRESQKCHDKMNPSDGSESPRKQAADAERNRNKFLTDKARDIRERIGGDNYLNYDKRNLEETIERDFSDESQDGRYLLDDAELYVCNSQVKSPKKDEINDIQFSSMHRIRELKDEVASLLKRNVVHEPLKNVNKDDTKFSDWLFKGIELHGEENPKRGKKGKCLFCENDLTMERMDKLRKHFSKSYEVLMEELEEKDKEIRDFVSHIKDCDGKVPIKDQLYPKFQQDLEDAKRVKQVKIDKVLKFLDCLQKRLDQKKSDFAGDISDTLKDCESILDKDPDKDVDIFLEINRVIANHNRECGDHEGNIATSAKKIELHMIAQDISKFRELENNLKSKKRYYEELEDEITRLKNEIKKIESELKKVRKPVEELNDELHSYLGHDEILLELPEKDGLGYRFVRRHQGVSDKKSLSEGEKTALALLYFLKSLKDGRFKLNESIIVIDDPVSSMDSNFLYNAFSYIKTRTKDAGQLFILTHNYAFFTLVRNWYWGKNKRQEEKVKNQEGEGKNQEEKDKDKVAEFYMLEIGDNGQKRRTAEICKLDPLLRDYQSEYHYLFKSVYRLVRGKEKRGLEIYQPMPNIARRLLEAFLSFRKPKTDKHNKKLSNILARDDMKDIDEDIKIHILKITGERSHGPSLGELEDGPLPSEATRKLLGAILKVIEKLDEEHYADMVEIVTEN